MTHLFRIVLENLIDGASFVAEKKNWQQITLGKRRKLPLMIVMVDKISWFPTKLHNSFLTNKIDFKHS